jgi:hypothetical protein
MVAACSRADTGVGPSIASGSHTCSGNWADLPITPMKSSAAVASAIHGGSGVSQAKRPVAAKRRRRANSRPMSASFVIQKAFTAARPALGRSK